MAANQPIDTDFPIRPPEPWPLRFAVLAAVGIGIVLVVMGAAARGPSDDPAWGRYVAVGCQASTCLSPRQFITSGQAAWMKRELGACIVDIRTGDEPAIPLPHAKPDAHVPFMERVGPSAANPITASPDLQIRVEFANEAEDVMRAAHVTRGRPLILTSPSIERSILAALLLQERGHSKILILYG
jgi:hypothetical protein